MEAKMEHRDWAAASDDYDLLAERVTGLDLAKANEAQTRYDVIDNMIQKVLGWQTGQVRVEEPTSGRRAGYVDYILKVGDSVLIIEAKKSGAAFPAPTTRTHLKLSGVVLSKGPIGAAINQAEEYALDKNADAVCVTNGLCWCFYSVHGKTKNSTATLLFPFTQEGHAERLFNLLSEPVVRNGSINRLSENAYEPEDKLLAVVHDADGRVNRNSIADQITPALNEALYADALLSNPDSLEKCYVPTDGRVRFDSQLGMHLADSKPVSITAPRIKRGKQNGPLERLVKVKVPDHAPPVTLIIGPVGAGKSTYLKHFELVSGKKVLHSQKARWIYIDFEKMGKEGSPRDFMYKCLRDYLLADKDIDFESLIRPAYEDTIQGLKRGPLALIAGDKDELDRRVTNYIQSDYDKVEPYVDKLFSYLANKTLCVIVMDNVDLYEDEELETTVFSEGLGLSKRLKVNVIVSMRDRTYVNHRNSPTFNAYELKKLWIDPPPFKAVLSSRLSYSRKILSGKSAQISADNGIHFKVPDLSVFFDIVQRSVLQGTAGQYVDNVADLDIRRGLDLIKNFLTSGHIQADRALKAYIEGETEYYFPFHEVFKGTVLANWKYFKESRADAVNLFDSYLGVKRLRLMRLAMLNYLAIKAKNENTIEVPVKECMEIFRSCGASDADTINLLENLRKESLIRTTSAENVSDVAYVVISRSGGYYLKQLCRTFVYTEQCMFDTAIEDTAVWSELTQLTHDIDAGGKPAAEKMKLRRRRISVFLGYLEQLESLMLEDSDHAEELKLVNAVSIAVMEDTNTAVEKSEIHYAKHNTKVK